MLGHRIQALIAQQQAATTAAAPTGKDKDAAAAAVATNPTLDPTTGCLVSASSLCYLVDPLNEDPGNSTVNPPTLATWRELLVGECLARGREVAAAAV